MEQIAPVVEGLAGVVVGEIEAIERDLGVSAAGHHNQLVRVALPDRRYSVVCGAPNAAAGVRAAFAPPGARLPGLGEVKAAKIRGVVSEGILCSEKELGISDDHSGLLLLPAEAPLGADLVRYLGPGRLDPRRRDHPEPAGRALGGRGGPRGRRAHRRAVPLPQGAGHRGRAGGRRARRARHPGARSVPALLRARDHRAHREAVAAVAGPAPARGGPAAHQQPGGRDQLHHVGDGPAAPRLRPRHAGPAHRGGAPRAARRAHEDAGRPGARDRARHRAGLRSRARGRHRRRHGRRGQRGDRVHHPRAARGRLLGSGLDPADIARRSGCHTDAAYRFERGGDIEAPPDVLARAAQLMADLGGGTVARGVLDAYPAPRPHRRITLRLARVERVVGACPPRGGRGPHPAGAGLRGGRLGRRPAGGGAELPARRAPGGRPGRGDRADLGLRPDPADARGRRRDHAGQAAGRPAGGARDEPGAERGRPLRVRELELPRSRPAQAHGLGRSGRPDHAAEPAPRSSARCCARRSSRGSWRCSRSTRTGRCRTRGSSRWAMSSRRIGPRTAIGPRTRTSGSASR